MVQKYYWWSVSAFVLVFVLSAAGIAEMNYKKIPGVRHNGGAFAGAV
jgi:hypothetical protein